MQTVTKLFLKRKIVEYWLVKFFKILETGLCSFFCSTNHSIVLNPHIVGREEGNIDAAFRWDQEGLLKGRQG